MDGPHGGLTADGLLAEALAAHGGLERWNELSELRVRIESGGFALASKLVAGKVRSFEATLSTHEPRTEIHDFTGPGRRGVFEPDRVRIESADGELLSKRADPRSRFLGGRRLLWWDSLDVLHFAGYALWNYMCAPFVFARPGFEVREIEPWEGNRRLEVTFPPDVPTHSREQVFHFDGSARLVRLDYTAEVFGRWARSVHLCEGHREFGGLVWPTSRRVYPRARSGKPRPFPTLVWIEVGEVFPS